MVVNRDVERANVELVEIQGIIGLAKADDTIKEMLLEEVINEFGNDLERIWYGYFSEQGVIR